MTILNLFLYCAFVQFSSVQSLSHVWFFAIPWTVARKASLSITNLELEINNWGGLSEVSSTSTSLESEVSAVGYQQMDLFFATSKINGILKVEFARCAGLGCPPESLWKLQKWLGQGSYLHLEDRHLEPRKFMWLCHWVIEESFLEPVCIVPTQFLCLRTHFMLPPDHSI